MKKKKRRKVGEREERKGKEEKKRRDEVLAGSRGLKPMLNKNCSFRKLGREIVGYWRSFWEA